jgi:hypothetical protein
MATMTWTATIKTQDRTDRGRKLNQVSLQGSSGTYLAGGIVVSGITGGLGLPYGNIDQLSIVDNIGDGYIYQWNKTNASIQIFSSTSSTGSKLTELTSSTSPSSTITVEVIGY